LKEDYIKLFADTEKIKTEIDDTYNGEYEDMLVKKIYETYPKIHYPMITIQEINKAMKEAANPSFEYSEKPIVSSDIVGTSAGAIFDATLTDIVENNNNQLIKTVSWYDSEYGFVSNLVRLTEHFAEININ